jgi:3-oxoacyl-[acyl-carrier-protein] synthase-3
LANILKSVGIIGVGSAIPEKILTNQDLEKIVDTSDEWIKKRTGITTRHILEEGEPVYNLAVAAAKKAIENANVKVEEIELIIVATDSPDYLVPSTASIVQGKIGAVNAATFDLNSACTGFIYALTTGSQFVKTGLYKKVLVIAAEGLSKITDWTDRNTCVLFGDGAGAVVLSEVGEGEGILNTYLGSDGEQGHKITAPCLTFTDEELKKRNNVRKSVIWMDGAEVFKFAVKVMESSTLKVLKETGVSMNEVGCIIPHQANIRIIDGAAKRLNFSKEKIFTTVDKYGNSSSASIAVALDEAVRNNFIKSGDNVVLVGFGGGLTWGAILLKWV